MVPIPLQSGDTSYPRAVFSLVGPGVLSSDSSQWRTAGRCVLGAGSGSTVPASVAQNGLCFSFCHFSIVTLHAALGKKKPNNLSP